MNVSFLEDKRVKYEKEFIKRSVEVHQGYYSYEKVEYKAMKSKVIVVCPVHGDFHPVTGYLYLKRGCAKKLQALEQEILTCGLFDRVFLQDKFIGGSECFSKAELPHVLTYLEEKLN